MNALDKQTFETTKRKKPNFLKAIESIPMDNNFVEEYNKTVEAHNRIIRGEIRDIKEEYMNDPIPGHLDEEE